MILREQKLNQMKKELAEQKAKKNGDSAVSETLVKNIIDSSIIENAKLKCKASDKYINAKNDKIREALLCFAEFDARKENDMLKKEQYIVTKAFHNPLEYEHVDIKVLRSKLEKPTYPTFVLNMIVKNEKNHMDRCLKSFIGQIDYYVILDTGSTDGTPEYIIEFFDKAGIPGEVHIRPWNTKYAFDFKYNRNTALKLAENIGNYIILCDADMVFNVVDVDWKKKIFTEGKIYMITLEQMDPYHILSHPNVRILNTDPKLGVKYEYRSRTHEYVTCVTPNVNVKQSQTNLINYIDYGDGNNKEDKYVRDIKLLLLDHEDEQTYPRPIFYIAQSASCLNLYEESITWYKKRLTCGGYWEEIYYSKYKIGLAYKELNDWPNALYWFLEAHQHDNRRAEPLYEISSHYRTSKGLGSQHPHENSLAMIFAEYGAKIPCPTNSLFVSKDVYDWKLLSEIAINAYYCGKYRQGLEASDKILLTRYSSQHVANVKQSTFEHNLFYIKQFADTRSGKLVKLTCNQFNKEYKICNPSVVLRKNKSLVVSIREVSYIHYVDKLLYQSLSPIKGNIDTHTHILELDESGATKKEYLIEQGNEKTLGMKVYPMSVTGLEDMRFFEYKDEMYCISTVRITNSEGRHEMLLTKFDTNYKMVKSVVLRGYEDDKVQKNWLPLIKDDILYFLYSTEPTVVLKPDLETGKCTVVYNQIPKFDLVNSRGSGGIIKFTENTYLYVTHQVQWKNNRRYYFHRFIEMDENFEIVRVSFLFYLLSKTVEYVAGLAFDESGKNLIMTFGFEDKEAYSYTFPKEKLNDMWSMSIKR